MADSKAVFKAVKAGDIARFTALLEEDPALIHARDDSGATPLHFACWKGHTDLVRLMLNSGADCSLQSQNPHWGGTPLHAAAHANQRGAAELLIAAGADVRALSGNGRTPLDETAIHNAAAVARLLKLHGAG